MVDLDDNSTPDDNDNTPDEPGDIFTFPDGCGMCLAHGQYRVITGKWSASKFSFDDCRIEVKSKLPDGAEICKNLHALRPEFVNALTAAQLADAQ